MKHGSDVNIDTWDLLKQRNEELEKENAALKKENETFKVLYNALKEDNKMLRQLLMLYQYDRLTNMFNSIYWKNNFHNIAASLIKGIKEGKVYTIFACDIDGLKSANDTLGHTVADEGIKTIANIINEIFEKSMRLNNSNNASTKVKRKSNEEKDILYAQDSITDMMTARVGGDEFHGILSGCTEQDALKVATRIKDRINKIDTKNLSLSIGFIDTSKLVITENTTEEEAINMIQDLFVEAEKRMYGDKNKKHINLSEDEIMTIINNALNRVCSNLGLDMNNPMDKLRVTGYILNDIASISINDDKKTL